MSPAETTARKQFVVRVDPPLHRQVRTLNFERDESAQDVFERAAREYTSPLYREAHEFAEANDTTVEAVREQALREYLDRQ